jgi:hypothetical protein
MITLRSLGGCCCLILHNAEKIYCEARRLAQLCLLSAHDDLDQEKDFHEEVRYAARSAHPGSSAQALLRNIRQVLENNFGQQKGAGLLAMSNG